MKNSNPLVYIAGPMRGYPHWNFDAFDTAMVEMGRLGINGVSPADIDRVYAGEHWQYPEDDPDAPISKARLHRYMLRDHMALVECDAVLLLNGWKKSKGATAERYLAAYYGIPCFEEKSLYNGTLEAFINSIRERD